MTFLATFMSKNAAKKQSEEGLLRRFFQALCVSVDRLALRESPDFEAEIHGRRIGIEVTVFHADEGRLAGGSALRQQEQAIVRTAGLTSGVYGMWGSLQWEEPFVAIVRKKASRAQQFDRSGMDELWLLVAGFVPIWGAMVSTAAPSPFVTPEKLGEVSGRLLEQSAFDVAFFHLVMDKRLFKWTKAGRWVEVDCRNR